MCNSKEHQLHGHQQLMRARFDWLPEQDLNEMELLMGRAEEERVALEAEVRAMRCAASEAAAQLALAEEQLSVRSHATCQSTPPCIVPPTPSCEPSGVPCFGDGEMGSSV